MSTVHHSREPAVLAAFLMCLLSSITLVWSGCKSSSGIFFLQSLCFSCLLWRGNPNLGTVKHDSTVLCTYSMKIKTCKYSRLQWEQGLLRRLLKRKEAIISNWLKICHCATVMKSQHSVVKTFVESFGQVYTATVTIIYCFQKAFSWLLITLAQGKQ